MKAETAHLARQARITAVIMLVLASAGVAAGLLWAAISPDVQYVIVKGEAVPADPEEQELIGFDGTFAAIALAAGLISGFIGYLLGRRWNGIALLTGLAAGGVAAALIEWRVGHLIGLEEFRRQVSSAPDGTMVNAVPDLRARGVLMLWPLFAVAAYGLLEGLGVGGRPTGSAAGDRGAPGSGEPDQVGGGELDLQAAPTGRDVDGGEPRG